MRPFFLLRVVFVPTLSDGRSCRRATQGQPATIKLHIAAKAKFSFAVQSAAATEWHHTPCCLKPLKLLGIYAKPSLHSAGKIFAQPPFKAAGHRRACKACFFAADRAICAQSLVSLYVEGYQRFVAAGVHVCKAKAEQTLGFLYSVLGVYFEKLTYFLLFLPYGVRFISVRLPAACPSQFSEWRKLFPRRRTPQ